MPSSGILRFVVRVRTNISEERDSVLLLLVTANIVPSSLIFVILMMEVIHSSDTMVHTRTSWCNMPEDGNLDSNIVVSFVIWQ
jgi:hypothetical protein